MQKDNPHFGIAATTNTTYVEVSSIIGEGEILSVNEGLVVEIGSHIVSDGYHKSSDLCEVALVTIFSIE